MWQERRTVSFHFMDISESNVEELADLAELEFSPIAPEDAAELDDRVYLLGVRPEFVNR